MWEKWGEYAIRNGNYSISSSTVKGVLVFQLWTISPEKNLGKFDTYQQAQIEHKKLLSKDKK